jgi:riboflavin kinase/FMN adenylyltransferase
VEKGFSRGKQMGIPTANLRCDDQLVPADAVYAGRCTINGKTYPAAISIGTNPTFGQNPRQIEAHLIGFDGDLYGKQLTVELVDWLREQRIYIGVDPLMAQIHKDIAVTVTTAAKNLAMPIASLCATESEGGVV